jgi:hypothetical protein
MVRVLLILLALAAPALAGYAKGDRVRLTPLGAQQYPALGVAGTVGTEPELGQEWISVRAGGAAGVPVLSIYLELDNGPRDPLTPKQACDVLLRYAGDCSLLRGLTIEQKVLRLWGGMEAVDLLEVCVLAMVGAPSEMRGRVAEAGDVLKNVKAGTVTVKPRVAP